MIDWLALAVALPLLGSVLAAALPSRSPGIGTATGLLTTTAVLSVGFLIARGGVLRSDLGDWGAPLGIALQADGLSAALLVMANLVALGISAYALGYFPPGLRRHFWPLWLLLWSALNALFMAADVFNIYVTLELLGIAAAALGALTGGQAAIAANIRYLLVGLLGSMTYLLGVAILYTGLGTLDLGLAAESLTPGPLAWTAGALMLGGLLLKAALFPLHFWLPPAHAQAPAPVSAALSALVVKAAFYLILRLWIDLFAPVVGPGPGILLGALGAGGVIWGSWRAFRAERLKLLAAYSTVAQIGYLFLFFPLMAAAAPPRRQELLGALLLLALTHGFAKAGLFLSAGLLQKHAGHDRIAELGPAIRSLPAVAFAMGLAGVALVGLPPSGTFIAKWILLVESFTTRQWWWALVVLLGTLMASAYVFRLLANAFGPAAHQGSVESEGGKCAQPKPIGSMIQAPALLMALVAAVLLGLGAEP
ncbi:MAG: oxidoreductase, partial [Chromatiaceae bacterium]|nr:oxidoreductase [Chromatiaceae bacterium]